MVSPTPPEVSLPGSSAHFAEDGIAVTPRERVSLPRAAAWVAPATFAANLLGYGFNLVLSRWLGPTDYGELGALLGLSLILLVPALALQPVVARVLALAAEHEVDEFVAAALRRGVVLGLLTAGLMVISLPVTMLLLRLDAAPVLWLALSLAPAPVLTAAQGVLQGRDRFRPLAVMFVVAAGTRLAGAIAGTAVLGGVTGALAGTALGSLLASAVAVAVVGRGVPGRALPASVRPELAGAVTALFGLLVLGNIDVLLARNRLSATEAGLYAVGAVLSKAAFWGPQFVQVIAFTRLAEGGASRVLGRSVAVVAGVGAGLTLLCAVAGRPLVELAFGERYADLGGVVWLFAATGSILAVAQLLLYARIAVADRRLTAVVVTIVSAEIAAVLLVDADTVRTVALVALGGAAVLAASAAALQRPPATSAAAVSVASATSSE